MKFSFGFLFVLVAVCSLFGAALSASVCETKNKKTAIQACELRCRAKDFEEGKCINNTCVCSKPREQTN